jgi:hypothetical protein
MNGFAVELDSVGAAASSLRESLGVVGDWNAHEPELAGSSSTAGHPVMSDAIVSFCDEWRYGFAKLADDIEALAASLEQAVAVYAETESVVVDAVGSS